MASIGSSPTTNSWGPILAMIRDEQMRRGPERRSGPRWRGQLDALLFEVEVTP
jgi:hypothetical protein